MAALHLPTEHLLPSAEVVEAVAVVAMAAVVLVEAAAADQRYQRYYLAPVLVQPPRWRVHWRSPSPLEPPSQSREHLTRRHRVTSW